MPAASQVTITAKDGPAQTVTAQVLTGVSRIDFQVKNNGIVQITADGVVKEYDIAASATLTATIASGVITMVINQ
jgi:hypothetical protein